MCYTYNTNKADVMQEMILFSAEKLLLTFTSLTSIHTKNDFILIHRIETVGSCVLCRSTVMFCAFIFDEILHLIFVFLNKYLQYTYIYVEDSQYKHYIKHLHFYHVLCQMFPWFQ